MFRKMNGIGDHQAKWKNRLGKASVTGVTSFSEAREGGEGRK